MPNLMKMIRRLSGDRASVTAIVVLAAYLLLLQGFVAGMSRSAIAAAAADPLHSICASAIIAGDVPPAGEYPSKKAADCPCASLCRLAGMAVPAVLADVASFGIRDLQTANRAPVPEPGSALPPLRGFVPEPRAPPFIS
ncbi:hypothetical protein IE4872_CH03357 [Rhizobium gallicum]|uniref:DUF2946 domain-containing protein n=1 Tax=Rhizobium gallicum TaxID=56730 RepID=A0A1L5NM57_9HYPH|nr:hypothetical protein [Rhizobium gallicum]APO68957.1 hypothetical protein IE4872_CH03357 [Rhizobium gallicum]